MFAFSPLALMVLTGAITLTHGENGWPASWSGRPHRRAISDELNTPNKIEDEEAMAGSPFAPGSYKLPLGMWAGSEDKIPEKVEENMPGPNFQAYKNSKKNTADTTFSSGLSSRMGPRHLRPSKAKRTPAFASAVIRPKPKQLQQQTSRSPTLNLNSKVTSSSMFVSKSKGKTGLNDKNEVEPKTIKQQDVKGHDVQSHEIKEKKKIGKTQFVHLESKNKTGIHGRVVRKREGRMSREEQRRLMGELGNILKDDDEKSKRIPIDVKRQANEKYEGDEPSKESTSALIGINGNKESGPGKAPTLPMSPNDRQAFDDWLRDEYFRNIALSMATAKRKRNSPAASLPDMRKKRKVDFESNDLDETEEQDEIEDDSSDEVFDPEAIQERLEVLENAVLTDAVEKIVEKARDTAMAEAARDQVAQMLAEAFYLERLQSALEDKFPSGEGQQYYWKQKNQNGGEQSPRIKPKANWGKFDDEKKQEWMDDSDVKKRAHGNLAEALSGMSPSDDKRRPDELLCPELRLLTSDCAGLEDAIPPESSISYELQHICNKHEVCYTCGEAFGLTSASCDSHFLREAAALCRDDEGCEPGDLNRLLAPLRERRVFYKRSVPPVCYRAHVCIGQYLTEP